MPTEKQNAEIEELRARVGDAANMFFTDYRGLTVGELRTLRNELLKGMLEGPTAVAFVPSDPVAAAKALVKFANDSKKLQIKAAFVEGKLLAAPEVESRSEIRGKHDQHAAMVVR